MKSMTKIVSNKCELTGNQSVINILLLQEQIHGRRHWNTVTISVHGGKLMYFGKKKVSRKGEATYEGK